MRAGLDQPGPASVAAAAAGLPWIVSVDDHVTEPPNIWQDRLPARYREIGPRLVRQKHPSVRTPGTEVWADVWHYEDVRDVVPYSGSSAGAPKEEADMEPITFDQMRRACFDAPARLVDMDLDGVEAALCFPNTWVRFCGQRFLEGKDRELALLCVRAYNDWLIEEWTGVSDGRLIASHIVPLWDPELAAAEVRRNAARGATAVCFSEIPARLGLPSMYSGHWEPFFAACAETETVINLHIGSSSKVHTTSEDAPMGVRVSNHFGNSSFSLSDWLLCGAFSRHPRLRVAFSEGQAGWVPYLLSRLDKMWSAGNALLGVDLPEAPSSYVRDHTWFCVFDDPTVLRHLDIVPIDQLCFETDYPHQDGSWPDSRAMAFAQTQGLSDADRLKVLRTNAAKLYRIERVLNAPADGGRGGHVSTV